MTPNVPLCLAPRSCASVAGSIFPDADLVVLEPEDLRPPAPFAGPLFAALAAFAGSRDQAGPPAVAGLVVPAVWLSSEPRPAVAPVADHVNLALRGPLTGRWPAGMPRSFPCMTGIYQPGLVRVAQEPPIYSPGVIVAGVGEAGRLSAFERRVLEESDHPVLSDCLVPAAIAAAYYRVNLAAGVVPVPP